MSQVCVACNTKIPVTSKSCTCGHVVSETKTIGGRRFSEYRASLYLRLTNRRQRALQRRITSIPREHRATGLRKLEDRDYKKPLLTLGFSENRICPRFLAILSVFSACLGRTCFRDVYSACKLRNVCTEILKLLT